MIGETTSRRRPAALLGTGAGILAAALLTGCAVIPRQGPTPTPPPPPRSTGADALPQDTQRHRVALLVPLSGPNAAAGQAIANAAAMALLDTGARDLRITNYDTGPGTAGGGQAGGVQAGGAQAAAARAIAEGNGLILGPLTAEDIPAVAGPARAAKVPVVSFSNDAQAASRGVFVMGASPTQSVARTLGYARSRGVTTYAALAPRGMYGERASGALMAAVKETGGQVLAMEPYERTAASVGGAVRRLDATGGFQAVMILDGGRIAALAAPLLRQGAASRAAAGAGTGVTTPLRLLGTELWSGDAAVNTTPALRGAWFSALPDARFRQFSASYRTRFGTQPYRVATIGYDAVLLTLRLAREWRPGEPFPVARLTDPKGFLGLDGPFRFGRDGVVERAFEVREVRAGGVTVVSPAPTGFAE